MVVLQTSALVPLVGLLLLALVVVTVWRAVVVVDAHEKRALTVFGEYRGVLEPGVNFVPPFVSQTHPIDMRTQRAEVAIDATTRDRWAVTVEVAVELSVSDAERAFLETDDHRRAVLGAVETVLCDVVADLERDAIAGNEGQIRERARRALDDRTGEWGVAVEAVEVLDLTFEDGGTAPADPESGRRTE